MKKNQKEIEKAWTKMELNSIYDKHKISKTFEIYDENKSYQIIKDARKTLNRIKNILKI